MRAKLAIYFFVNHNLKRPLLFLHNRANITNPIKPYRSAAQAHPQRIKKRRIVNILTPVLDIVLPRNLTSFNLTLTRWKLERTTIMHRIFQLIPDIYSRQ